jgi:hypothetical protein
MHRLEHANLAVIKTEEMTRFLQAAFPDFQIRGQGVSASGIHWRHLGDDDFYLALNTVTDDPAERNDYSDEASRARSQVVS